MLTPILSMGALAFFFGGILAYAAEKFKTEKDPIVEAITEVVPGVNCGACGYPGCDAFAEAVAKGEASPEGCKPGGKKVADRIIKLVEEGVQESPEGSNVSPGETKYEKQPSHLAEVACLGAREVSQEKFEYDGVRDCRAAMMYRNGPKACEFGCLGLGTCVETCPYGAIEMRDHGLPKIDHSKCTGCHDCVNSCPKNIIHLTQDLNHHQVICNSKESGAIVEQICEVGCIGCGVCAEGCPVNAVHMAQSLATIDPHRCINCGLCKEQCPRDCIVSGTRRRTH